MNIKKILIGLLTATALLSGHVVCAANNTNGTEFGVVGDLSVYGASGYLTPNDPDVKIKGFTVFGATQAAYAGMASPLPGSVMVNASLAVSSGAYFLGGSTFASGAYFNEVSSFTAGPSKIFVNGGTDGQVMSYNAATGAMQWSSVSSMVSGDNMGSHIATTTLNLATFDVKNAGYITASSEAISGQLVVYGTSTLTGNTGVGGTLDSVGLVTAQAGLAVTGGNAAITNNLTANGSAQLGNDATVDIHGINQAPEANVALSVKGDGTAASDKYVAKFYSGANLSAWIRTK